MHTFTCLSFTYRQRCCGTLFIKVVTAKAHIPAITGAYPIMDITNPHTVNLVLKPPDSNVAQMMEFFEKSKLPDQVTGASATFFHDDSTVLVVGGCCANECQLYINLRSLDVSSATFKPVFVSTNGVRNRQYHASVRINKTLYVFGGCIFNDSGEKKRMETINEILTINRSLFGMQMSVHSANDTVSRQGLTSNTVGENLDKAVIYGGYNSKADADSKPTYTSEVHLFCKDRATGEMVLKPVEVDKTSPGPANRAFHTAVVCGDKNQFLVVFGGHTDHKETLLNDVWLLDLTEVLSAEDDVQPVAVAVDPKAKPAKGGKDAAAAKGPTAYWTKILGESAACAGRYLHCSYVVTSAEGGDARLCVFGGVSAQGPLPMAEVYELQLSKDSSSGRYTAIAGDFAMSSTASNSRERRAHPDAAENFTCFGAAAVPITVPGDQQSADCSRLSPVAVIVTGGAREFVRRGRQVSWSSRDGSSSYMVAVDGQSKLVNRIKRAVRRNNQSTILQIADRGADDKDGEGGASTQTISYPSGDVYQGEVARSSATANTGGSGETAAVDNSDDRAGHVETRGPELGEQSTELGGGDGDDNDEDDEKEGVMVPHGTGTMTYYNNDTYQGQWAQGERHGRGTFTAADGSVYTGDYLLGRQTGQGTHTVTDDAGQKQAYSGAFVDGVYHGEGEMTYGNGDVFKGQFAGGRREGRGVLTWASGGGVTAGLWSNDELAGPGQVTRMPIESLNTILSHSTHTLLSRGIMAATANGSHRPLQQHDTIGSRTALSRGLYSGPVADGVPSGELGECHYEDGSEYRGAWRSGRRNGQGTYIFPNQDEYSGKWVGDKRSGFGTLKSSINPCYEGVWQDNLPHGPDGMLLLRDGKVFKGDFEMGRRNGTGKLSYAEDPDGPAIYEGMWVNDCPA